MIGISKLYCGAIEPSDVLRYGRQSSRLPTHLRPFSADRKPVVVWNITSRCNLACSHCYAADPQSAAGGELDTREAKAVLDDLAAFRCPVVLFSGGEPTLRADLPELVAHAVQNGLRAVVSSNGTLLDRDLARRLKEAGATYVGISVDGRPENHDRFRGMAGAFRRTLAGLRACRAAGLKVGLRHTLTADTAADVPDIFRLAEAESIPRICFYHLVYAGRGADLRARDLDHGQTRRMVDLIIDHAADFARRGMAKEVLTVDNHCDGPYLYLRMLREGHVAAARKGLGLLRMNGGNSTGQGIASIGWDGEVYPDQFWRCRGLGNVRERPFSSIWSDPASTLLQQLRDRRHHVAGRCRACRFLEVCGGNFRARAEAATGDCWGMDPACYLTDEEITA
jgi:12,18-didecarboxysiroheme deacetylase